MISPRPHDSLSDALRHGAAEVLAHIKTWQAASEGKLLVTCEGRSASGKSVLTRHVASESGNIEVVNIDDFLKPRQERLRIAEAAHAKGDYRVLLQSYDLVALQELVQHFRQGHGYSYQSLNQRTNETMELRYDGTLPVMMLDGVFWREPEFDFLDTPKSIVITVDEQVALQRIGERNKLLFGPTADATTDPALNTYINLYRSYWENRQPLAQADLVISS
jgi:uridine kinase